MPRSPQLQFQLNLKSSKAFGGELFKTRRGRRGGRPIDTKRTMHLVLRSSKAVGDWSFRRGHNKAKIQKLAQRFAQKNGVRILSLANVGNHLHFHIKLSSRFAYRPFIRGLTAAIAMAITGANRWTGGLGGRRGTKERFFDYRPFTRIVIGRSAFLALRDYIEINQLEGLGIKRVTARWLVKEFRRRHGRYSSA